MSDNGNSMTPATPQNQSTEVKVDPHGAADTQLLYKIYLDKRLNSQSDFYRSRVRENQANANFTFLFSTAVMSISALVAAVSAVVTSPIFSLLSAILPALAALLAAFRQLYGWERQISIYQDALMGLERVKLMTPDHDSEATTDYTTLYPDLVTSGENVFTGEVNQWGQFVQNVDKAQQAETTDDRATDTLMSDLRLSDDQIDTIRKIMAAGAPKPAFSEETITVHPEVTSALPSGTSSSTSTTAQAAPAAPETSTPGAVPVTVTTTRTDTTTIQPQTTTNFAPTEDHPLAPDEASASAPISVKTTRVDTTVVEHVIPPADTTAAPESTVTQTPAPTTPPASTPAEVPSEPLPMTSAPATSAEAAPLPPDENVPVTQAEAPVQESMDALTPGAAHVDTPKQEDIDALASHHELANEPPPPEALSALTPGAMHVDAPQAPPENPEAVANPNDNG